MTNVIFCLIFIQVGVFLIAGILLVTSIIFGFLEKDESAPSKAMPSRHVRKLPPVYNPQPLTRPEIEYLLGA